MPRYDNFLTAGDVISTSRAETLGSTQSSITAIQDTALLSYLDWLDRDFEQRAFTMSNNEGWSFLNAKVQYRTSLSTELADNITCGDLTFSVTDDLIPGCLLLSGGDPDNPTGALMIQDDNGGFDVVSFSNFADNIFTVDTTGYTISTEHYAGENVEFLYQLPTDLGRIKHLYVDSQSKLYMHDGAGLPVAGHYKIWGSFILFPRDFGSHTVSLEYTKKSSGITTNNSKMLIPKECSRYAIEMLNSFIYMKRRKREDSMLAKQEAFGILEHFLAYDINNDASESVYADF